jgi:hypothetical protein
LPTYTIAKRKAQPLPAGLSCLAGAVSAVSRRHNLSGNRVRASDTHFNDAEKATLAALLKQTIAADPFPMSPRVRQLRAILEKLGAVARKASTKTDRQSNYVLPITPSLCPLSYLSQRP